MTTQSPTAKAPRPCNGDAVHAPHYWGVGDSRFAEIDLNHCPGVWDISRPACVTCNQPIIAVGTPPPAPFRHTRYAHVDFDLFVSSGPHHTATPRAHAS